jgi:hypothetical protein
MEAKNWQEFIDNYDGYLTSPEMQLIEEVWEAAVKAMEENGSSHNKQSTPLKGSDGVNCCRHCGFYMRCATK